MFSFSLNAAAAHDIPGVCSPMAGGQLQVQNKSPIFSHEAAAPTVLPISGDGRTRTKDPGIWPLLAPLAAAILAQGPSFLTSRQGSLFPYCPFHTLIASQSVLERHSDILKPKSDQASPLPGDLQGPFLSKRNTSSHDVPQG